MKINKDHFLIANICVLIISVAATTLAPQGSRVFMFFAGCFMAQYLMAGKLSLIGVVNAVFKFGPSVLDLDKNKITRPLTFMALIIFMLIGSLGWVAGWAGATGLYYGFGILVGSAVFRVGVEAYLNEILVKAKSA